MTPESPDEFVTVAEAARRLNCTEPRLRRILQRSEFAPQTRQEERQTRTGTRTATVVSVSVLPMLGEAVEKGNGAKPEREHEHTQGEALSLQQVAAVYEKLARQQQEQIVGLNREVAFLTAQVERQQLPDPDREALLKEKDARIAEKDERIQELLADRGELMELRKQLRLETAAKHGETPGSPSRAEFSTEANQAQGEIQNVPMQAAPGDPTEREEVAGVLTKPTGAQKRLWWQIIWKRRKERE